MSDGRSFPAKAIYAMHPGLFFGRLGGGLVHGLREFVWLGAAFVYPVWVIGLLVMLALYGVVVAVLWVLLLPLRMYMRATHQGNYARADR
jgi:hypothetical protein